VIIYAGEKMEQVKKRVHARRVYDEGLTGKNIRIAVLDSGIFLHRDIRANVAGFLDFVNMRSGCYDDNGHGTHVAGIICANGGIKGMAPGANIIAIKVLDKDGGGRTECVKRALDWLIEKHRIFNIRLINFSVGFLSMAGQKDQAEIVEMLERLWDEGVAVVTAAGNNGPGEGSVTVPGISRKLITVGACDDGNPGRFLPKNYSGRGPTGCCIVKPEILAPGTDIISLDHRDHLYSKKSGTSMATPVVTGALALALEKKPSLRPEELKLNLFRSAEEIPENPRVWGLLNVDSMIGLL
jgi:serine protease AprX